MNIYIYIQGDPEALEIWACLQFYFCKRFHVLVTSGFELIRRRFETVALTHEIHEERRSSWPPAGLHADPPLAATHHPRLGLQWRNTELGRVQLLPGV